MTDLRSRLVQCFAAVFPDLDAAAIPRASTTSTPGWDSLANATLVTVVEEEFGTEIPLEELPALGSFEALLGFLEGRVGAH